MALFNNIHYIALKVGSTKNKKKQQIKTEKSIGSVKFENEVAKLVNCKL